MAAKTSWKYTSELWGNLKRGISPCSIGMFAWPCSPACPTTGPGLPRNSPSHEEPKPILKAQSTQTIKVKANALNTIIIVLMAHFFCTIPP